MAVINVYRRNEVIIHKSTVCSKASLLVTVTFVASILSPLIIAYRSQGLWIKEAQYREQPGIHFKYEVLFVAETSSSPLVWSSNSHYNSLMSQNVRTPLIKSAEIDENQDGKKDKLQFTLTLPLLAGELVYSTTLLLTFDFQLQHLCYLTLEGMGVMQHNSGMPIASLFYYTDLQLKQRHPLLYGRSNSQYNVSVFPTSMLRTSDWALDNILQKYWERNLTTKFSNTYMSWQGGSSDVLTVTLEVRYPEQNILYRPGFWYVMKWAWVQYFCLLAVVSYVVNLVKDWIFQNSIVSTWVSKKNL